MNHQRLLATTACLTVVLAVLLIATACTGEPMKTYADLAARPRLEETVARYDEMQQRIRDALDAELGPMGWIQRRDQTPSGCGHDVPADLGGRSLFMAPWGFDAPIPDQQWGRAVQIVSEITGEYGFTTAGLAIDEPTRHLINGVDADLGARYEFGSRRTTLMQVTTGCHLPA
jgi:hypothetical protein